MTDIREVVVFDKLKEKACIGKPGMVFAAFLRRIKLNWEGRQEPWEHPVYIAGEFHKVNGWRKTDESMEAEEDVLLEAETNGLNPGLQEERQAFRDALVSCGQLQEANDE